MDILNNFILIAIFDNFPPFYDMLEKMRRPMACFPSLRTASRFLGRFLLLLGRRLSRRSAALWDEKRSNVRHGGGWKD
jgi:hypothetical protein